MTQRLVVIGGDAGGLTAAAQARKRRGPDDLEIIALERGRYASYSACGIPYRVGGEVSTVDDLVVRTPAEFKQQGIDVRLLAEAVELDLDRRAVTVRDLAAGTDYRLGFDQLVLATGAAPARPPLPGIDATGVHSVRTLDDGEAVRSTVEGGARRAVVVGGGYVGLEMAEAFARRGLSVTLVEAADRLMSTLDPDLAGLVARAIEGLGVHVRTGEPVREIATGPDGRVAAVVTSGGEIPADVVVLGLGVRPNTGLAEAAGLPLGRTGGLITDRRMRVTGADGGWADGVWAAGDCVQTFHRVSRAAVHVALGTHATKQGRVAGVNIGGGYATFPGVLGTAITKVCDLEVARTGLHEGEADQAGFRYVTATVESTTRAGYLPDPPAITVKLVAEKRSGRLLGAQIVGREGAAKRIDTLAVALWHDMTVEDIANLDLSYAPPFGPVWDPVLIAARKAWDAVTADPS
ncbi:MAG TPA: FAD-dependent oxidoreductase [Mycobacteriales bacterium]|nr:FAD-dependent oxidoreductase [Mycobacteriales bacterium]